MNMLAKKAKKGFTIVELVIVIAVIAILAAVLIPTFTSVIENANESAAMQECKNEWTNYLAEVAGKGEYASYDYDVVYKNGEYVFHVTGGEFDAENPAKDVTTTYSTSFDVETLDEYGYTSSSNVKIYNTTKAAAAAAAAAAVADANGDTTNADTSKSYYAKVTDADSNVYYFELTYDSTNTTWVAVVTDSSNYSGTGTELDEATGYEDYTVEVVVKA